MKKLSPYFLLIAVFWTAVSVPGTVFGETNTFPQTQGEVLDQSVEDSSLDFCTELLKQVEKDRNAILATRLKLELYKLRVGYPADLPFLIDLQNRAQVLVNQITSIELRLQGNLTSQQRTSLLFEKEDALAALKAVNENIKLFTEFYNNDEYLQELNAELTARLQALIKSLGLYKTKCQRVLPLPEGYDDFLVNPLLNKVQND